MVRKTVEHATAAEQRKLREEQLEVEVLRAVKSLVPFARVVVAAQRATEACPKSGTRGGRLAHLFHNCPDGVNPFAAPEFFSTLFDLWSRLRNDSFFSRNERDRAQLEFEEILDAIRETGPRVKEGRKPPGWAEKNHRWRIEKEARGLRPILKAVLDRLGRPAEYVSVDALERDIRQRAPVTQAREVAEALWHYRTKRGPFPIFKASRRLAEALLPPVPALLAALFPKGAKSALVNR